MITFRLKIIFLLLFFVKVLSAQQPEDALRYTMMGFGPTARSLALGGAIGAVGNDPASLAYNPAGMAVNRFHVANVSLSNSGIRVHSTFLGNTDMNMMNKINLPSVGFIFTGIVYDKAKPAKTGWCHYNFGINITRNSDYARNFFYQGSNRNNSILDAFAQFANVGKLDKSQIISDGGSPENLAIQTGLIDNYPVFDTMQKIFVNHYLPVYKTGSYAPGKGPVFLQSGTAQVFGKYSEVAIAFGGNYNNRLFLGATLAVGIIRYESVNTQAEQDSGNRVIGFKSLTYTRTYSSGGASAGIKVGAIYRATEVLRVGLAWHSSQLFNLNDHYFYALNTTADVGSPLSVASDAGGFYKSYQFRMPSRLLISMALVKDKKGLLSADVEIPNYKNAVFIDSLNTLRSQNKRIAEMYRTGAVFRLGGEWLIDRYFVRAGLALLSSPFAKSVGMTDATQASQSVCFGAGYRGSQWNLDAGYGYTFTQEAYTPYALEQANNFGLVYNKVGFGKLLVTVVRRF